MGRNCGRSPKVRPAEPPVVGTTRQGSREAVPGWLQVLDKPTGARRDRQLDDDFEYAPEVLDRSVQTPDQIPTIARTLRDRWQTDLFPQRQELPETLVFAKDGRSTWSPGVTSREPGRPGRAPSRGTTRCGRVRRSEAVRIGTPC